MIWALGIGAILALYMLLGCAILVWSEPRKGEPAESIRGSQAALVVVGWFPLLLVALVTGAFTRTPAPDQLPRVELEDRIANLGREFDPPSGWQTRVWGEIDRGDREPPGPSWSARWLPWIVPALVLAVTAALALAFGGAR